MALLVHPKHFLPTEDFEGLEEVVNFERACVKRHNDLGRPLAARSQEDILRGYLTVVDKQVVPNLWEPGTGGGEQPTVDLSYADAVQVKNQFDPWTSIITTKNGRVSTIEDIGEEFGPEARLPRKEKEVWNLDGLGFEARVEPMEETCRGVKRKTAAKSNDRSSPGKRSSPAALSQVLQNRLSQKAAPKP